MDYRKCIYLARKPLEVCKKPPQIHENIDEDCYLWFSHQSLFVFVSTWAHEVYFLLILSISKPRKGQKRLLQKKKNENSVIVIAYATSALNQEETQTKNTLNKVISNKGTSILDACSPSSMHSIKQAAYANNNNNQSHYYHRPSKEAEKKKEEKEEEGQKGQEQQDDEEEQEGGEKEEERQGRRRKVHSLSAWPSENQEHSRNTWGGLMTMNSQVSINSRGNGERTNNPIESNQIKLAYS